MHGGPLAQAADAAAHEETNNTIGISDTGKSNTFDSDMLELPASQEYRFGILGQMARRIDYLWDQTNLAHFLTVRTDFTNFAHPADSGDRRRR